MISAGLKQNLVALFDGMSAATMILITLGLMLVIVEFFQPSYRIFTACGTVLLALGIVVRMLSGGTAVMLFYMVFAIVAFLLAVHMIMLVTQKRAWLTTSLALKLQRTVEMQNAHAALLGREGVATTDIRGTGHMALDDVNIPVVSETDIPKDTPVRVVRVSDESGVVVVPVCDEED